MPEVKVIKATPSKAAMELVRVILSPLRLPITEEQYRDAAAVVDEQLAELLKTSQTLRCAFGGYAPTHGCACNNCDLANALEPWKPK